MTALGYPAIRQGVGRFVDAVVLRRTDYETGRAKIAQAVGAHESPESVLDEVCSRLSEALTARDVRWAVESDERDRSPSGPLLPLIERRKNTRQLKGVAVRVVHERCVRDLHEEEMRKLATEAELRALRAQINPHFLSLPVLAGVQTFK